jgi:hypothetical protein
MIKNTLSDTKDGVKLAARKYERRGLTGPEKVALNRINGGVHFSDEQDVNEIEDENKKMNNRSYANSVKNERIRKPVKIDDIDSGILSSVIKFAQEKFRLVYSVLSMDALRLLLDSSLRIVESMASWAGGRALTASQTLLVACSICIAFRRGILTFLGSLLTVKLLRIAFSANNSPSSFDDADTGNDNYISAR